MGKSYSKSAFTFAGVVSAIIAVGALAACAPVQPAGPERVSAKNPTVTYTYRTDQELLTAGQKAATFCRQYQTTAPKSGKITNNPDGTNNVVFECAPVVAPAPAVAVTPSPSPMTYTYRTSQELLQVSENAQITCMKLGKRSAATITSNPNGSKTVTFRCVS